MPSALSRWRRSHEFWLLAVILALTLVLSLATDSFLTLQNLFDLLTSNAFVGILASGVLSHFLVNETLDREVVQALERKDHKALKSLPLNKLVSGSSEIRNWTTGPMSSTASPSRGMGWLA